MPHPVVEIFQKAAAANLEDTRRKGNVVHLEQGSNCVVAGDIHGYRHGFQKIVRHAELGTYENTRLVLQEIVHGPVDARTGFDRSVELLMRAASLKIKHPDNILFVIANHDVAQISGSEITKAGRGVCKEFLESLKHEFKEHFSEVNKAIEEFICSMPLAVKCANGTLISHSLPSPNRMEMGGTEILNKPYTDQDYLRGNPLYEWVWGRNQTQEQIEKLSQELDVKFFLLAHQHCDDGFVPLGPKAAAVLSDHQHGYITVFDDNVELTGDNIRQYIKPMALI